VRSQATEVSNDSAKISYSKARSWKKQVCQNII